MIGKSEAWKRLNKFDRLRSLTKLLNIADTVIFDTSAYSNKDYDYPRGANQQALSEFFINNRYISKKTERFLIFVKKRAKINSFFLLINSAGEMMTNDFLKTENTFPSNKISGLNIRTDEAVVLNIEVPSSSQKFMFLVYRNLNEIFSTSTQSEYTNVLGDSTSQLLANQEDNSDDYYNSIEKSDASTSVIANQENEVNSIINSNVISFKMNDRYAQANLKKMPIELRFKHLRTDIFDSDDLFIETKCSYWNYGQE
jgi:hypothetical protein